jgi:hypothetical protein
VKPTPVSVAALIVTGAVPVDVKVTDCVAAEFTTTLPNPTLVALMLSVGAAEFNCRTKLLETLPTLAVSVTASVVPTGDAVAVNSALVPFAGTVTVAGSVTAALLLVRLTLCPPFGAAAFSVTVQASITNPVMDVKLQESAFNTGVTLPLKPITAVAPVEELLTMVSCPATSPVVAGWNCTFSVAV